MDKKHINERSLAEIIFFHIGLMTIVLGQGGENKKEHTEIALRAVREHTLGMDPNRARKIETRARRMVESTLMMESKEDFCEKAILTLYMFIDNQTKQGLIDMPKKGEFPELFDKLLGNIDPENEVTQKRMVNARKTANRWLRKLKMEGYYANIQEIPCC